MPGSRSLTAVRRYVHSALLSLGLDVRRAKKCSEHNLLGLFNYPIKTVIDVGANVGKFARSMVQPFPHAKVYCFEPAPDPFRRLLQWADGEGSRIVCFNLALGDREGRMPFFVHTDFSPSSSLLRTTQLSDMLYPQTLRQEQIEVEVCTLDAIAARLPRWEDDTLVKIDAQGFDDRVITGGEGIIRRARACIVGIGLDRLYEDQAQFMDVVLRLQTLGLTYSGNIKQTLAPDAHVVFFDALFMRR